MHFLMIMTFRHLRSKHSDTKEQISIEFKWLKSIKTENKNIFIGINFLNIFY